MRTRSADAPAAARRASVAVSLVPAFLSLVALGVQLVFVLVWLPRLGNHIDMDFGLFKSAQYGPFRVGASSGTMVAVSWSVVGLFVALSVVSVVVRHRGSYSIAIAAFIATVTALFTASIVGQLEPGDGFTHLFRESLAIGIAGVLGLLVGVFGSFAVYRLVRGR